MKRTLMVTTTMAALLLATAVVLGVILAMTLSPQEGSWMYVDVEEPVVLAA